MACFTQFQEIWYNGTDYDVIEQRSIRTWRYNERHLGFIDPLMIRWFIRSLPANYKVKVCHLWTSTSFIISFYFLKVTYMFSEWKSTCTLNRNVLTRDRQTLMNSVLKFTFPGKITGTSQNWLIPTWSIQQKQ